MKIWTYIKALLLLGLGFHFTVIAMDLLPDNPLKHQFKYEVANYVSPFFSQTWNLFAPNPVNKNSTILLKYYVHQGNGQVDSTAWNDIMEPLLEQRRQSFWSPVQRVLKSMTSISNGYIENTNRAIAILNQRDSIRTDRKATADFMRNVLETTREHRMLMQYAKYVFHTSHAANYPSGSVDSVAVRFNFFSKEFPRFSERHLDYFDEENYKYYELITEEYKLLSYAE